RVASTTRENHGAEQVRRASGGPASSLQPGKGTRPDLVCGADQRCAADVRLFHEHRHDLSLLLSALPRKSIARGVWIRGDADSDSCAAATKEGATLNPLNPLNPLNLLLYWV